MSSDFLKDAKELFIMILIAALGFLLVSNVQAQSSYNDGITLDMNVQRTIVYDSVGIDSTLLKIESLSHEARTTRSVERVRLEFPNKDIIILKTQTDTIKVELISIWENCHFVDKETGQHYTVKRDFRQKSFFFTFFPHRPLIRPSMLAIHVEPHLPYSGRK